MLRCRLLESPVTLAAGVLPAGAAAGASGSCGRRGLSRAAIAGEARIDAAGAPETGTGGDGAAAADAVLGAGRPSPKDFRDADGCDRSAVAAGAGACSGSHAGLTGGGRWGSAALARRGGAGFGGGGGGGAGAGVGGHGRCALMAGAPSSVSRPMLSVRLRRSACCGAGGSCSASMAALLASLAAAMRRRCRCPPSGCRSRPAADVLPSVGGRGAGRGPGDTASLPSSTPANALASSAS